MTLRSIALSTAALLITTVLAGCAPAVPECHNAEVVASVQELFERGYQDAMDSPQTKFSDYVQIKVSAQRSQVEVLDVGCGILPGSTSQTNSS